MREHLPHQPERLTDSDLIAQAIERARSAGEVIPDAAARVIASQLHGGQFSAMYGLASCGAIDQEKLSNEYEADYTDPATPEDVKGWIDALRAYVGSREDSEPVQGWNRIWLAGDPPEIGPDNRCTGCGSHLAEAHDPGCYLDPDNDEDDK